MDVISTCGRLFCTTIPVTRRIQTIFEREQEIVFHSILAAHTPFSISIKQASDFCDACDEHEPFNGSGAGSGCAREAWKHLSSFHAGEEEPGLGTTRGGSCGNGTLSRYLHEWWFKRGQRWCRLGTRCVRRQLPLSWCGRCAFQCYHTPS